MMESFRLKGMKGFLDSTTIELRPLTILIGQNSSGKSSLARFPLVLKQTILDDSRSPLLLIGNSIDYGNYQDVVFKHEKERLIEFELTVKVEDLLTSFSPIFGFQSETDSFLQIAKHYNSFTFHVSLSHNNENTELSRLTILHQDTDEPLFKLERYQTHDNDPEIIWNAKGKSGTLRLPDQAFDEGFMHKFLVDPALMFVLIETDDNLSNEEIETTRFYGNLFLALHQYLQNFTPGIKYIGPHRQAPERYYRYKGNSVNHVGRVGEFAPLLLGQDLKNGGTLFNSVSNWLKESLNFSLEIEEMGTGDSGSELFKLFVRDHTTGVRNNLMDVGHGLSQLIPIIVETFMLPNSNSMLRIKPNRTTLNIIEQPELHLHPAAQASLADLFLAGINQKDSSQKRTFLIETHSEHMLIRLRRFIAEGKLSPEDVAIYYTEKQESDGSIKVERLKIEPDGSMQQWPKGFFQEDYQEAQALRQAMRQHSKK